MLSTLRGLVMGRLRQGFRRGVGLIAAYSLALQILFNAASIAQFAALATSAPAASVICHASSDSDGDGESNKPAEHHQCILCASNGAAGILPILQSPSPSDSVKAAAHRVDPAVFIPRRQPSPRLSQGPPQIANRIAT
jgi:hypothetical protein